MFRVVQRWAGRDNPITTLAVEGAILHFHDGVATIDTLSERAVQRLRAFGFRVDRGTGRESRGVVIPPPTAADQAAVAYEAATGTPPPADPEAPVPPDAPVAIPRPRAATRRPARKT